MRLTIVSRAGAGRSHVEFLRAHVLAAAKLMQTPLREFSLAMVDDREMQRVHGEFLDDPTTTDVVTFPLETNDRGEVTEGEVVICVSEAIRCAKQRGHRTRSELLLYAIHGMLHLSGYDDTTKREFKRMHAREDEILSELGLGRVFDVDAPAQMPAQMPARAPAKASRKPASSKRPRSGGR